jgi:hypothetical protein
LKLKSRGLANDRAATHIRKYDTGRATVTEAANLDRLAAIDDTRIADAHAVGLHLGAFDRAGRATIDGATVAMTAVVDIMMAEPADVLTAGTATGDAALAEAAVVKMAATPRAAVTASDLSEIADIFEPLSICFQFLPGTPEK